MKAFSGVVTVPLTLIRSGTVLSYPRPQGSRMILGIGLDVCDVKRLRRALARPGFRGRVFDESEIRDCERRLRRHFHYSARFAAKEAFFKALGTGWGRG